MPIIITINEVEIPIKKHFEVCDIDLSNLCKFFRHLQVIYEVVNLDTVENYHTILIICISYDSIL